MIGGIGNGTGWSGMLEMCIEAEMRSAKDAPEEVQRTEKTSERMTFMRMFWTQALERAQGAGAEPGSDQAWAIVDEASEIGKSIAHQYLSFGMLPSRALEASTSALIYDANRMRVPTEPNTLNYLSNIGVNFPSHQEFELAVQTYLGSSWRTNDIDRHILRLLLELEVGQYIHQMVIPTFYSEPSKLSCAQTVLRRNIFNQSLKVIGSTVLALVLIVFLAFMFPEAAQWIIPIGAGTCIVIGTLWLVFVIYLFASQFGKATKKTSQELVDLVSVGQIALMRYQGNGPIAISELRRDVDELRAAGYVLPQTLFAMLDILDREAKTLL